MSNDSLEKQVAIVRKFGSENILRLNVQKVHGNVWHSKGGCHSIVCKVEGCVLPISDAGGKWLGFW